MSLSQKNRGTVSFGAAPLGSVRPHPAVSNFSSTRCRRRGPRSQLASLRRSVPRHRRTLPDTCLGESRRNVSESIDINSLLQGTSNFPNISSVRLLHESDASANNSLQGLCIYSINIQCLSARIDELSHQARASSSGP